MSESCPLLILSVPAGHEIDPQAWEALRVRAGQSYGAGVMLASPAFLRAEPPMLLGNWGEARAEVLSALTPLINATFFNLDWLEAAM
jgi:hypothetical protein